MIRFKKDNIPDTEERSIILDSVSTAGVSTQTTEVFRYDYTLFQSVRSIVHISGTDVGAIHQVMTINSDGSTYCEVYPFITEGDEVDSTSGIGTFGSSIDGTDMVKTFYPDASIVSQALTFTSYNEAFYRELDEVNYTFGRPLVYSESEENYYLERYIAPLGLRNNLLRFPLEYEGIPIYEKAFDPSEVITLGGSIVNITEHFFSTGEELYYLPDTTLANNLKSPIEIQPVVDYRGITGYMLSRRT